MSISPNLDFQSANARVILQTQPATPVDEDPLIARHWQQIVLSGGFLLLIALIVTIGILNRQLEYALLFAFILSVLLIIPLMFF